MNGEHPIDLSPENRQYRFKRKEPGHTQGHLVWLDENCNVCGKQVNSWDERVRKALCYQTPHCEKCIAKEYGETVKDLRGIMEEEFGMAPCEGI